MLQIQRMRTIGYRNRMVGIAGFLRSIPTAPVGANYGLLSHPAYWASDASHLISCAAGDAIRWWKDAVTGLWYEQPTSGSRFIARQDVTGKWYAEGTGSQYHPWVNLSAFSQTNASFACAYRFYANVSAQRLINNYAAGPVDGRVLREVGTTLRVQIATNNATNGVGDPVANALDTDYRHIATLGGTTTIYRNGTSVASAADTSTGNFAANTTVGGRSDGFQINGRLYGLLIALSNAIDVPTWDAALHGYCVS